MSITRQEMLDRAVRGLASQGWERCINDRGGCAYANSIGQRCAWGWVDPSLSKDNVGDVVTLRNMKIGVAGTLAKSDLDFARSLQSIHDSSVTRTGMHEEYVAFARKHGLAWPTDVP